MSTAKMAGGIYKGTNGRYHDANGKEIPEAIVNTVLNTPEPEPEPEPEPGTVESESEKAPVTKAPVLTAAEKKAFAAAKKLAAAE